MASTAGLDQTDDASALSYFQKTVCLHDWWLVKSDREFEGKRLAVAGSTAREKQAVRLFSSAPIVKRYDFSTMETADGICVVIKGFINKPRTQENGFPSMVGSHFVLGFPTDWEEYATKFMEGDSTNGIHSGTIADSAIAGTEKSCPTSEQTPNNHEQVTHRGSLKNSPGSGCSMKHKNKMLSPKTKTFENPDGAKLNSSSGVSIQPEGIMDISDNVPDHSVGQILGSLSENVRGKGKDEKCTVSGLKSESIKMNSVPVASGNMSEILKNHKFEFEDNSIPSSSTYEGKSDDAKEGADRKKTKRNLIFDQNVSRSQELKNEKSIVTPESLSYGRSRSGRLLLPTMEFWRNQLPVYDADRKITGIMTEKVLKITTDGARCIGARFKPWTSLGLFCIF
ncbi:kinetochore-associated protein KNL-2 homolog isoform X1 [Quercus lobata]|uniref:kinetochore-associated protein KNL-2 homolog isoform X1 n=1 Tax=Quercus lobata TaxID=97700 RepID=UPI001245DC3F|nr:kinetochore-associated protein KNL-2 homolog isoform X1 [Quercus lobata]